MYTAYYNPDRCFDETRSGLFTVKTAGTWFPRSILGRVMALCAYIRCILVAFRLAWDSRKESYDVIFVDQVSAVNPFLKILTSGKVLFYCHFPDLLLAQRRSLLHMLYRLPLDWIEEKTTGCADMIFVNSNFTKRVFAETFPRLEKRGVSPSVLYPAVHPPTDSELETAKNNWETMLPNKIVDLIKGGPTFVSINRFERKKNIGLAIGALRQLMKEYPANTQSIAAGTATSDAITNIDELNSSVIPPGGPRLVIAGGYDARLSENVQYLHELGRMASTMQVRDRIVFLPSFTNSQRETLLASCLGVLYTPEGEHFGIVPLEAMASGKPVIACNSGGPLESIVQGETGYLCKPLPDMFAAAMKELMKEGVSERMGRQAQVHVRGKFSRAAFGEKLNQAVVTLAEKSDGRSSKKEL
jgi:alpha-1,3/alpha-1,6-mannosyltransferase